MKVLAKTDENYISIDLGYTEALDFHPPSLDAKSKSLRNKEWMKEWRF